MNAAQPSNSQENGIDAAIFLLVLLIATATGNALLILAMAIVALVAMTILHRHWLRRHALPVTFGASTAAVIVVIVAAAMTKL